LLKAISVVDYLMPLEKGWEEVGRMKGPEGMRRGRKRTVVYRQKVIK
jgi:hypothetical protein